MFWDGDHKVSKTVVELMGYLAESDLFVFNITNVLLHRFSNWAVFSSRIEESYEK